MNKTGNFKYICDKVSNILCTEYQFNIIKNHFRSNIESERRFEKIRNLNGLITILEKRGALDEEDISALKFIVTFLHHEHLLQDAKGNDVSSTRLLYPAGSNVMAPERVLPEISQDPIKRVDDLISRNIGQKWNELARNLGVPEGYIDELEHRYLRISDMVREVLIYYREIEDERYWRVNLCKALQESRRKDLSIKVQDIFASYRLM